MSGCSCLILGAEGSGKTLLLKKLRVLSGHKDSGNQEASSSCVLPTIPTVGTNVEELSLGRNLRCSLREYGGSMAPVWSKAYDDAQVVIYVVDASDFTRLSAATVLFLEALASEGLREKPFLLFLNKTDSPFCKSLVELKSVMRLDEVMENASQRITVVHGSCVTSEGLSDVLQWLAENAKQCSS